MPIQADFTYAHADLGRSSDLDAIATHHAALHAEDGTMNGWVHYPNTISDALVEDIITTADRMRQQCTTFLIVGIGGSFLGAKAGLEMLLPPFACRGTKGNPNMIFAGHHLSSDYYQQLFTFLQSEEVCLCVVSKSGNTLETTVIFSMLLELMDKKYGPEAASRIVVITDNENGRLYQIAQQEDYKVFRIPANIGGRYSVLTAVGLFPLAVAEVDIYAVLDGARAAYAKYDEPDGLKNDCYRYALARHYHERAGKHLEIFEVYEGRMHYFTEWLQQLFAESGCKNGRGLFPTAMQMTTDLHSLGQFLQDGKQDFIETVINVEHIPETLTIPDGIAGECTTLQCLNQVIRKGVCEAHQLNNTPNIHLVVSELTPYTFGEMVYFFEKSCAMSCLLSGVNPFDQPGVEQYKKNVYAAIKKGD